MRVSLIAITCAACGFDHGVSSIGGNGPSDGGPDIDGSRIDAMPDAPPDARACWGTFVSTCFTTLPSGDLTLPGTLDTSSAATCTQIKQQTDGPDLCVIAAQTIHVTGPVTVGGARPLLLLATDTIDITAAGLLDLASYRMSLGGGGQAEIVGAGEASGALCGSPTGGGSDNAGPFNSGGGGGAG
ncbi:MAG: hypothetical protein HOV81_03370, partial [Kofleriaceae bacterium]|nr:hypothetical protein [Kofleriaceae bacterium]